MSPRSKKSATPDGRQPTLREVLRPAELIGGSAALGVFVGFIVLISTRELWFAGIGFGIAFIVALVVVALFIQAVKPDEAEQAELRETDEQDAAHGGTRPVLGREDEEHRGH